MSNQRNLSTQQSMDMIIKLNPNLRIKILKQLKSFESSKNEYLLTELINLLEFKNQISKIYLEININQIKKIIDLLCKLEAYHQSTNLNYLTSILDKIKEEITIELIMLPIKLCLEFNKHINSNNESNNYEPINESNNYKPINESTNDEEKTKKIFSLVFKYLSIQDLLNCRLVNKKFKEFIYHTNGINKLIIGQPNIYNCWIHNHKLIEEEEDIISLKCFRTIQNLSIFNLDTNLKYLQIYDQQLELEELSNLINLEFIEFGCKYNRKKQQILNLNNLKVFVSNWCSAQLNTPKLEKIIFWNINQIKLITNPESIKHLITQNYYNKLEIFKNLEIIELRHTNQPVINENLLSLFKNLKKLKINLNFEKLNYSDEWIKNSLIYHLIKILNDKIELKRSIDIYLEGIKIENIDKFNELVSIGHPDWKFRLNNYDLLDLNILFIQDLCYKELDECVNNIKNDLPSSFFDKFFNINCVHVSNVKDVDGLNWFLNKLKYLEKLDIDFDVSLDEVFYNNLPNTIRHLSIKNRVHINYDFILKLSKLIQFESNIYKDLFDLALQSFLNLKYLKRFIFYYIKIRIEIEKIGQYFYLNRDKRALGTKIKLDYNQLIEECNKIKEIN